MTLEPFTLPDSVLLGAATAATQIEGGDTNNNWYHWYAAGRVKDGSDPSIACDHWNRVDEDTSLLRELGCHTYRMGVEWSRIEPTRGEIDEVAVEHYRDELRGLRDAGIVPLLTIYHFSHPLWFEQMGGWMSRHAVSCYLNFAELVVRRLGDLVEDWITINEPNIYLIFSRVMGLWPPGRKSVREYLRGRRHMVRAHRHAYEMIHRVSLELDRPTPRVGVAHHLRVFDPATDSLLDRTMARIFTLMSQDIFLGPMTGPPVKRSRRGPHGGSHGGPHSPGGNSPAPHPPKRWADFLGVNYYSRDIVRFSANPAIGFGRRMNLEGAPVNDMGWELYPEGLYRLVRHYAERYDLPVYITENGVCDSRDAFRARYIYDHLYQVHRLIEDGIDVRRYYYWTLTDNFEWTEGTTARFGLVYVDFDTQRRAPRESARFYAELCRARAVSQSMIERFVR